METKIIAAFPGVGKTTYHLKHQDTTLDSDSSKFSWEFDSSGVKKRNINFPNNYITHIIENIGNYEYIFVSTHEEVLDALIESNLDFIVVIPLIERKEEFLKRYKDRGDSEEFINLIKRNWDIWLKSLLTKKLDIAISYKDNLEEVLSFISK